MQKLSDHKHKRPPTIQIQRIIAILEETGFAVTVGDLRDKLGAKADYHGWSLISDLKAYSGQGMIRLSGGWAEGNVWKGPMLVHLPEGI